MKKVTDDSDTNENLIKLEGVEGLWYEQPDMLSKYKRRPNSLEQICSTHFAKMARSGGKVKFVRDVNGIGPDEEEFESDSDNESEKYENEDLYTKFNFIMTDNDEQTIEIPRIFKLRETLPGENPIMQRRSFPAARFHKVN